MDLTDGAREQGQCRQAVEEVVSAPHGVRQVAGEAWANYAAMGFLDGLPVDGWHSRSTSDSITFIARGALRGWTLRVRTAIDRAAGC